MKKSNISRDALHHKASWNIGEKILLMLQHKLRVQNKINGLYPKMLYISTLTLPNKSFDSHHFWATFWLKQKHFEFFKHGEAYSVPKQVALATVAFCLTLGVEALPWMLSSQGSSPWCIGQDHRNLLLVACDCLQVRKDASSHSETWRCTELLEEGLCFQSFSGYQNKTLGRASGMILLSHSSHSNIFRTKFQKCSLMHFATRIVLLEPCFKNRKRYFEFILDKWQLLPLGKTSISSWQGSAEQFMRNRASIVWPITVILALIQSWHDRFQKMRLVLWLLKWHRKSGTRNVETVFFGQKKSWLNYLEPEILFRKGPLRSVVPSVILEFDALTIASQCLAGVAFPNTHDAGIKRHSTHLEWNLLGCKSAQVWHGVLKFGLSKGKEDHSFDLK